MKNDPAFPIPGFSVDAMTGDFTKAGLTKRELFAAMAMQGLLSANMETPAKGKENIELIARAGVVMADALIAELERTK